MRKHRQATKLQFNGSILTQKLKQEILQNTWAWVKALSFYEHIDSIVTLLVDFLIVLFSSHYLCSKTNQLITLLGKFLRDHMFLQRSGLRLQSRKKRVLSFVGMPVFFSSIQMIINVLWSKVMMFYVVLQRQIIMYVLHNFVFCLCL